MNYRPQDYHTVTPYIQVKGVSTLIDFLKAAFDAEEREMMKDDDGRVLHGEMKIGDSMVMLAEARDPWPAMPASYYIYVPDTDATYRKGMAAGAESIMEPADQFYGDRNAGFRDKSGNCWWIATHIEDVSPEEMKRRSEQRTKEMATA